MGRDRAARPAPQTPKGPERPNWAISMTAWRGVVGTGVVVSGAGGADAAHASVLG